MPLSLPCDACSFRRVKCDGKNPCSTCLRREQSCTHLKVRKRRGPKGPRKSTNARVQAMQKNLGIQKSCSLRDCSLPASDESQTTPEPVESPQPARHRISLSTYYVYIDIFQSQLYTVWPIVSTNALKAQLGEHGSPGSYALAAALCAATLAQLRLPGHTQPHEPFIVTSSDFVRECIRFRAEFVYRGCVTLESLLTSLFLHMYYANVDQIFLATFALRDAITHAHLLGLGNGDYDDSQSQERQVRLRVYWILLVTERTFCMQHDLPITLQTIDDLPVPIEDGESDPALLAGFCNLVRLFTRIDGPLLQAPYLTSSSPHSTYSRAAITDIQEALQTGAVNNPTIDEVQRVDVWITLAWLSSLLWKYSASHFMLTTEASNAFFTPSYPFVIAKNFLSLVSGTSLDSVRPHGYGMEIKLSQLANSLIDVLVYVPSLAKSRDGSHWGPRHAVVALENLLGIVAGGSSERLDKLHSRMAQMEFTPTPRRALLEVESDAGSQGSERLCVGEEIAPADETRSTSNLASCEWSGEEIRDDSYQGAEKEVQFSNFFPLYGASTVPFPSGDGHELYGHGGASYGIILPADILSHIPHSTGCSALFEN
ncbi:hypothetical protein BJX61DRAFT_536514 [Aspergillus egyptiacus]|nr:hypothetical protein BJX61DRAFT_536514 [Aspergillus egyptiacus]